MQLNLFCPINLTSYGYCSVNILRSLYKKEHTVYLHPIDFDPNISKSDSEIVNQTSQNALFYDHTLPCLKIWHQFDMKTRIGKGKFVGYTFFEVDKLSPFETHSLKALDHILVCSGWAEQICRDAGFTNVSVAPLAVDRNIFHENIEVDNDIQKDTSTKFLNIGKWEIRKGHDVLLEAFNKAFEPTDNVRLIMNCNHPMVDNLTWNNSYQNCKLKEKIYIFPDRLPTQENVANLMSSCDVGVFPARAEGWNLELLEMMACGKQVISTNYSGNTEFCNAHNCELIEMTEKEEAYDGVFFDPNNMINSGRWMHFTKENEEQLIEYMRKFHKEKEEYGRVRTNLNGIATSKIFNWDDTVDKITESLL